jgi:hypothetical protein
MIFLLIIQVQIIMRSYGNWVDNPDFSWGNNSRKAVLGETDSAKAVWNFEITQEGYYHVFTQFPSTANHAGNIKLLIKSQSAVIDSAFIDSPVSKKWLYLSTKTLTPGFYSVEMTAGGAGQAGKVLTADVIKVSPLVRNKAIIPIQEYLTLGEVPLEDSIFYNINIRNGGIENLQVSEIISVNNLSEPLVQFPVSIDAMGTHTFRMKLNITEIGIYSDTIIIRSDDPLVPELYLPFSAKVIPYFVVIDNEETEHYFETAGTWSNSVAQAFGGSSRIAYLNQNPRASAYFEKIMPKQGKYDLSFIVPTTVNAATTALYRVYINGTMTDSLILDQNINSGQWVQFARRDLTENASVKVVISDPGGSGGAVLRTDALKIGMFDETSSVENENSLPVEYALHQNYPNPFNPVTKIRYSIPAGTGEEKVTLAVYDVIGRMVAMLINEQKAPGIYETEFNAAGYSSGVYFCRLNAGTHNSVIKMVVLK